MPHIFVTEDDPDIRTSIADVLAEEGYEVREFCNGEDTLRELKGGSRPCVLLLDLLMPEMGGQQLLDAIRCDPSLAQIAVVVITGAKAPAVDAEVLSKPFELGDLVAVVSRYCGHAGAKGRPSMPHPEPPDAVHGV